MTTGDPLLDFALSLRSDPLTPVVKAVSYASNEVAYLVLIPVIYWVFSRRVGFLLLLADAFATTAAVVLKDGLALPRPPDAGETAWLDRPFTAYAFPSGHVTATATTWVSLAVLLRSRGLALFAVAATAGVSVSRLYLGVHYTRDVAGGAAIGLAVGALLWLALPPLGRALSNLPFERRLALVLIFPALALFDHSPEALIILSVAAGAAAGHVAATRLGWALSTGHPKNLPFFGVARVALGMPVLALLAIGLGNPVSAEPLEIAARFGLLGLFATLIGPRLFALVESRAKTRGQT